ncbi:hypothetical protein [Leucobacter luti]|uniref:hypothetical protein n=1 Tax=Leucobacter luti TaxID=340320 RepID=UPI001C692F7F|nr:hypothetical protein [Leucobacter luti]QYM75572.1 hypothetical protein K1X41_13245 [Leucobacter luti]
MAKHGVPKPEEMAESAEALAVEAEAAPTPNPAVPLAAEPVSRSVADPAAEPARRGKPRRRALWLGAGAVAALAIGVAAWSLWPASDVHSVTVLGVEYSTNLQIEEHDGYAYVTVPVNTEAGSTVLEVTDADDTRTIREFLAGLDTLVPGEHVLTLRTANLHIIVDGMVE